MVESVTGLKGLTARDRAEWDKTHSAEFESLGISTDEQKDRYFKNLKFKERFQNDPNYAQLAQLSDQTRDRVYNNSVFKETFEDREDYNQLASLSPEERDSLTDKALAYNAAQEKFSQSNNWEKISQMTPDAQRMLIDKGYNEEHNKLSSASTSEDASIAGTLRRGGNRFLGFVEGVASLAEGAIKDAAKAYTRGVKKSNWESIYGKEKAEEMVNKTMGEWNSSFMQAARNFGSNIDKRVNKSANDAILEEAQNLSDQQISEYVAPRQEELKSTLDNLSGNERKQALSQARQVVESTPHGLAFKDSYEIKNMSDDEILNLYSKYIALSEGYGEGQAAQLLDRDVQNDIEASTSVGDEMVRRVRNAAGQTLGFLGSAVANMGLDFNKFLDYQDGGNRAALYIQGRDSEGNVLPWYLNTQYWQGVSNYGTIDNNEIKRIQYGTDTDKYQQFKDAYRQQNPNSTEDEIKNKWIEYSWDTGQIVGSGISRYNPLAQAGTEHNILGESTFNGAFGMMGQVAAQTALSGLLRLPGYAAGKLGASAETVQTLNKAGSIAALLESSDNIGKSYGNQAYLQTYQNGIQKMEEQVKQLYSTKYQQMADAEIANAKENGTIIIDPNKTYNKYYSFAKEEFYNSEAGKDLMANLQRDAVAAHTVSNLTEALRYGQFNLAYRSFLYKDAAAALGSKPNIQTVWRDGKQLINLGKTDYVARQAAKNFFASGSSNYLDELNTAFSVGIGTSQFNDYYGNYYSPNEEAEQQYSALMNGVQEGLNAAFKPSSFSAFASGALGFFGLNPVGLALAKSEGKTTPGAPNKQNLGAWLNYIAANGTTLGQDISNSREQYESVQKDVDFMNQLIQNNYIDAQGAKALMNTLKGRRYAIENGDMLDIQDSKEATIFNVLTTLQEMRDRGGEQSDLYQQYLTQINNIANGQIEQEDIDNFINDPQNAHLKQMPEEQQYQIAQDRLEANAQDFLKYNEDYQKAKDDLMTSPLGRSLQPTGNNQLLNDAIYKTVLSGWMQERRDALADQIKVNTQTPQNDAVALTRARQGKETELVGSITTASQEELTKVNKNISDIQKSLESLEQGSQEYKAKEAQLQANLFEKLKLESLLDKNKARTNYYQNLLAANMDSEAPVLSANSILGLNAQDMQYMFTMKELFTPEQQQQIRMAQAEFIQRDPQAMQKLADLSTLVQRIEVNNEQLVDAHNNPRMYAGAALYYNEVQQKNMYFQAKAKAESTINNFLKYDNTDRVLSDAFREMPESVYKDVLDKNLDQEDRVNNLWNKELFRRDAQATVSKLIPNETVANAVMSNLEEVIFNTRTPKDAINAIERFIDKHPEEAKAQADYYDLILNDLQQLNWQRNATKVKKREKARKKAQKDIPQTPVKIADSEAGLVRNLPSEQIIPEDKETFEEDQLPELETKITDGNQYGWGEYKIGDKVYNKQGQEGTVTGFGVDNEKNNQMIVTWKEARNVNGYQINEESFSSDTDKQILSKEAPKQEVETPQGEKPETPIEVNPKNPITPSSQSQETEAKSKGIPVVTVGQGQSTQPVNESPLSVMNGILIPQYGMDNLKQTGDLSPFKSTKEGDSLDQFYKWLDSANIHYQDVIDNKLDKIVNLNPKVRVLMVKAANNATNDAAMGKNYPLYVIEYDSQVERFHKREEGSILHSNNKDWLVIGVARYKESSQSQTQAWKEMVEQGAFKNSISYFNTNQGERFFVDEFFYTEIANTTPGWIVKSMNGEPIQIRRIGELAEQQGVQLKNLKWGIQIGDINDIKCINVTNQDKIHGPQSRVSNSGRTFVLVKAANGHYIPIALKAVGINELAEGSDLKENIISWLNDITSRKYDDRLSAINEFVKYVYTDENNQILIGTDKLNSVTIKKDGIPTTFNLEDPAFDRNAFVQRVMQENFLVQSTLSKLFNEAELNMLNEAGALITDVAKLGTAGADYTIYPVDMTNGEPIKTVTTTTSPTTSTGEYQRQNYTPVRYEHKTYRYKDNNFYNDVGQLIQDANLIIQLQYNKMIQDRGMTPNYTEGSHNYYIVSNDASNPLVIARDSAGHISIATGEAAAQAIANHTRKVISEIQKANAEKALPKIEELSNLQIEPEDIDEPSPLQEMQKEQAQTLTGTQTQQKQEKSNNSIQDLEKKSLEELQNSKEITTFAQAMSNKDSRNRIKEIFKYKGWPQYKKVSEFEAFLKSKNVSLLFSNLEDFLSQLEKCI